MPPNCPHNGRTLLDLALAEQHDKSPSMKIPAREQAFGLFARVMGGGFVACSDCVKVGDA